MPYINKERREVLNTLRVGKIAKTAGELNYMITQLCRGYCGGHDIRYSTYNDIIGALESAKLEFYRRLISEYEDLKIQANGDVY